MNGYGTNRSRDGTGANLPDRPPPRRVATTVLTLYAALLRAADRLLPSELALYFSTVGFGRTRLLGVMVELGIAEALASGPASAEELAGRLDLDADALHRVLRALVFEGSVRLDRRGRFRLTRKGQALRRDHPRSLSDFVRYLNLRSTQDAWAAVGQSVRTGEPTFPLVHGRSVWEHFAANPEEERIFAASMGQVTRLDLPAVVFGYPWPEEGTVCDVAGGAGALLATVLVANPGLRGVLVEAPGVLPEAEGHFARAGVRERVTLTEGDIFERVEAAADIYVMKDILHDWDDERCRKILGTVRAAMPPGARVVLVEAALERDEANPITASLDVHMLTQADGGRQRSIAELRSLLRDAGLRPAGVHRTAGPALVEGVAS